MAGKEGPLHLDGTKTAGADYSAATKQYTLVKSTGANFTTQVTEGGVVYGVLQDRPNSSQAGAIAVIGSICRVRKDSTGVVAIVVGDKLQCSTSGAAMKSAALSDYIFGRSREAMSSGTTGFLSVILTMEGHGSTL